MLLTDLVHLTDGMPSKKGEFPNYQKYFTMGKAIYDVFSAGSRPYAFATDKKLHVSLWTSPGSRSILPFAFLLVLIVFGRSSFRNYVLLPTMIYIMKLVYG